MIRSRPFSLYKRSPASESRRGPLIDLGRFPNRIHNRTIEAADLLRPLVPSLLCQPRSNSLGPITGADRHLVARGLAVLPAHLHRAVLKDFVVAEFA